MSTMQRARETWAMYAHKPEPVREAFEVFSKGQFFRDGKMNRDGHGTPNPDHPPIITKATHVFHHKDRG